jgi:acyl-CoA:acyl-CoA alkyltransferase
MHYNNVCIEAFGYTLPDEIVTSQQIERRLEPLYRRLRLPEGRLELMTGIRERRFWTGDSLPSDHSIASARRAIAASGIDPQWVGALIHGSVCRDYLEPATACRVHHQVGLPHDCMIYDVSNACLGLINGMLQAANMIELGQVRAALVVGTENGRPLGRDDDCGVERQPDDHAAASEVRFRFVDHRLGQLRHPVDGPGIEPDRESAAGSGGAPTRTTTSCARATGTRPSGRGCSR